VWNRSRKGASDVDFASQSAFKSLFLLHLRSTLLRWLLVSLGIERGIVSGKFAGGLCQRREQNKELCQNLK
jgi:hypothetical protein